MKNKIVGLLLKPLLYARWSFVYTVPLLLVLVSNIPSGTTDTTKEIENFLSMMFFMHFLYVAVFGFVFGNCEAMSPITKWLLKVFKVSYTRSYTWQKSDMHSYSAWEYPIVVINGKKYGFSIKTMGGAVYDSEASLQRKVLFTYLFGSKRALLSDETLKDIERKRESRIPVRLYTRDDYVSHFMKDYEKRTISKPLAIINLERIENIKKVFDEPELKSKITFHGSCHGCNSQLQHGIGRCKGCKFFVNWSNPSLVTS